jgi:predicted transcriptional regulator
MDTINPYALTDQELNETAEAATRAYFEALIDQGRVFDHTELSTMIDLAVEGAETRKFVKAMRR